MANRLRCELASEPQSFCVPVRPAHADAENLDVYMRVPVDLGRWLHFLLMTKGTALQGVAIVEEGTHRRDSSQWWLVLTWTGGTRLSNFKAWLKRLIPTAAGSAQATFDAIAVHDALTLCPAMQRRLGWGDARNTPELLSELRVVAELAVRRSQLGDGLLLARMAMAKQELAMREPAPVGPTGQGGVGQVRTLRKQIAQQTGDDTILQAIADMASLSLLDGSEAAAPEQAEEPTDEGFDDGDLKPLPVVTVYWMGSFMVHDSKKEPTHDFVSHLLFELGTDQPDVESFVTKALYMHGKICITEPIQRAKHLQSLKYLWAFHLKTAPSALSASDLDVLEAAVGMPVVSRCRVCFKPCSEGLGVHQGCQTRDFTCRTCGSECRESYLIDHLELSRWQKVVGTLRCSECAAMRIVNGTVVDKPVNRPGTSKVSRKRAFSS
jgi:hypothetical protein